MIGRRSKFGNKATMLDGERFASKKEAKRHAELLLLQRGGQIRDIKRQPRIPLHVNGKPICTYVADWIYFDIANQVWTVEDAKGFPTAEFRIKWKLAQALIPHKKWVLS